ncbi:hypothetical protein ACHQM5_003130 [Ranunculus cassubicifolius]
METATSRNPMLDDETIALENLLDIFGAAISLREIASAFCKSGRNFDVAVEMLSESNECSSSAVASTNQSNGGLKAVDLSEQLSENISKACEDRSSKVVRPRKHSSSLGTVSGVIGKEYSKSTTLSSGSSQRQKPLIVNLSEFPLIETQEDDVVSDSATRKDPINNDVEDFIVNMLGEGFQLGMDVIHDVLGSCGYDANKSIEKLLDLSASSTLKRSDDIVDGFSKNSAGKDSKQKFLPSDEKSQNPDSSQSDGAKLSREVLTSLFGGPVRCEDPPKKSRLVRAVKKPRSYGKIVSEPLPDRSPTLVTDFADPQGDIDDVEEEDNYLHLRRVAKEHWITMKEYYKAAVDAFAKGNKARADELLKEGQFFHNKAREADERSSQKIFECSTKENPEDVILDLRDHDVKKAIHLLKLHLSNLASIGSFQNLKVIVEADLNKAPRRRRVLKVLETESIKWTEKESGTIVVQLGEIDPDELSFANKSGTEADDGSFM